MDICIDTNENLNEIGGFCIYNKTNIISNIKSISESQNKKIDLSEWVTFFIYSNKDNILELSQNYKNITFIELGDCANNLIKYYNYPDNTKFYILGIDSPNKLSNSSINYYQYFVYNENGTEMDIKKICHKSKITMHSPIIKKELINYNISYELYKQGYDIYNINSNFYYDDCTPSHIGNLDIGFYKRKEEFYPNNISFCMENCSFEYTDYNLSRFICNCDISNNNTSNDSNLIITKENFFNYIDDNINYRIFKCFDLFIGYNYKKINIGFYLGILILLIFSINIIFFATKAIQSLRLEILQNINYIKNNFFHRKNTNKKTTAKYNKSNPSKKNKINKRSVKENYDIYPKIKQSININSNSKLDKKKIVFKNKRKKNRKKHSTKIAHKHSSSDNIFNFSDSNSKSIIVLKIIRK